MRWMPVYFFLRGCKDTALIDSVFGLVEDIDVQVH